MGVVFALALAFGIEGLHWLPPAIRPTQAFARTSGGIKLSSARGPGWNPRTVCPVRCASTQALGVPCGKTFVGNVCVLGRQSSPDSGHGADPEDAGAALEDAAGAVAAPPWLTRTSEYGHGRLRATDASAPPQATSAPEHFGELDVPSPRLKTEWSEVVGTTSRDILAGPRSPGGPVVTSTSPRTWVSPTSAATETVTVVHASAFSSGIPGRLK